MKNGTTIGSVYDGKNYGSGLPAADSSSNNEMSEYVSLMPSITTFVFIKGLKSII